MTCERVEDAVVMAAKSILEEIVEENIRIVE